jgi:hypothetical protein
MYQLNLNYFLKKYMCTLKLATDIRRCIANWIHREQIQFEDLKELCVLHSKISR